MATQNYVRLLGVLSKLPLFKPLKNGTELALFHLIVINKSRTEKDTYYYNVPNIMTDNAELIAAIKTYNLYDIIEVEGVITTKNVCKTSNCKVCGEKNRKEKATLVIVTPLYLCQRATGFADNSDALQALQPHEEISNKCFVIGTLMKDPQILAFGKRKKNTVRYPISIKRKYYIVDSPDVHTDYPWVNTVGSQAEDDMRYLHAGSVILIDGYIQTRKATQTSICEYCGTTYDWKDSAVEIIGNSVEYLQNYYTPDEVIEQNPFDYVYVEDDEEIEQE